MKRSFVAVLTVAVLLLVPCAFSQEAQQGHGQPEPPMLGIHWARGFVNHQATTSPDMTWHGGTVLTSTQVAAIFWGTSWPSYKGDKISGIDLWYVGADNVGANGTAGPYMYSDTTNEFSGSNGQVTSDITYLGHIVDGTAAPNHAPPHLRDFE